MPLQVEAPPHEEIQLPATNGLNGAHSPIRIGLVNNMPDPALEGTELQFSDLLAAAAGTQQVHLCFSHLPEVPRSPAAVRYLNESYWPIETLLATPLDALIVTGAEPRTPSLRQEAYWDGLVGLMEWAQAHTTSSIWSCLAAHAAVLHLDGVERVLLSQKCCGVFTHSIAEHTLTSGLAGSAPMPQSRLNDLQPASLAGLGYTILARSPESGAGIFVKERDGSLFVFVQGHPEYDERALLKEYQRDVGRFLSGERTTYPSLPLHYFPDDVVLRLEAFRAEALADPDPIRLGAFPFMEAADALTRDWGDPGVQFYRNWLAYLVAKRGAVRLHTNVSLAR
ncbi:MAG: homoserine O-acetyltransferase/O-succinyltransferase family protein [Gemmatimonadaceae bacterium]